MTTQANIPLKWYVPFANGDASRVEIPVTTADPTRASQTLGFPPLTMQPPESGGVPPQGEDFNGGMNQVARVCWWVLNGGGWPYDASFATQANILGYPNGAKLQSADFRGDWISTADSNQNNPDTNGTGWVPGFQYGVTALTGLTGGTVTPTPAQAAKGRITLAGTLGSALTVVLPTWLKDWVIVNNTTGAFVTIVKTAAGSGVTIPQNGSPTAVRGDGTNIIQQSANIATGTTPTQAATIEQSYSHCAVISATNATWPVPAGMVKPLVYVVGGGGGGGGAGATAVGVVDLTGVSTVNVTIGGGGAGGINTATPPGAGGTTSFGAFLTAGGGAAGINSAGGDVWAGAGGASTGGTSLQFSVLGGAGKFSRVVGTGTIYAAGGAGGDSSFGSGQGAPVVTGTAAASVTGVTGAQGAGGSGCALYNASANGGAGGAGFVVLFW